MQKRYFLPLLIAAALSSCAQKNDEQAEAMAQLQEIQRDKVDADSSPQEQSEEKLEGEESPELEIENKVLRGGVDRSRIELKDFKKTKS
ncbi:hypothetical protein N9892_01530 [bacterium]|nr:hypothetical protein [bacterium]